MSKGKAFLKHLSKIIEKGSYNINDLDGVKVLSHEDNQLKCEHEGKAFDYTVEEIKASETGGGAAYELCDTKSKTQATKTTEKKANKKATKKSTSKADKE